MKYMFFYDETAYMKEAIMVAQDCLRDDMDKKADMKYSKKTYDKF